MSLVQRLIILLLIVNALIYLYNSTNNLHLSLTPTLKQQQQQQQEEQQLEPSKKKKIDCGCPYTCTEEALNHANKFFRCKQRIEYLMNAYGSTEKDACVVASGGREPCTDDCNPNVCPPPPPPPASPAKMIDCGCPNTCTEEALQHRFVRCKQRVEYLMNTFGNPERYACAAASREDEFCSDACNPTVCRS